MSTKELECFLMICEEGSITKAAKKLYISVQGLSRIIRKIETELGATVLTRTQNGTELTDEGRILEKHARKIMEHMNFVNLEIEKQHNLSTGMLSIAASYGLIGFYKPTCIIEFRQEHPDIQVDFREFTDEKTLASVWYGESDIGLTYAPINDEKYSEKALNCNELYLIVNRNNPLSRKKEIEFEDLRGQKFVLQNSEFKLHQYVKKQCEKAGFTPEILFETNGICMCNKMCSANIAVSVTMKHTIEDIIKDNIMLIPFKGHAHQMKIEAVYKKDRMITEEMSLFLEFMEKWAGKMSINC